MREIKADKSLVAYCGLYCGACGSYLKERCPGCHENTKAGWCKVRKCCMEHKCATCADCREFSDPAQCAMFNNFISKIFGLIFNSNRPACVMKIKELGIEKYAGFMAEGKRQSMPRKG
jgi:hypothetical protein